MDIHYLTVFHYIFIGKQTMVMVLIF